MSLENLAELEAVLREARVPPRMLHQIWAQRRPVPEIKTAHKAAPEAGQLPWLQGDLSLVLLFAQKAMQAEENRLVCDLGHEIERLERSSGTSDIVTFLRLRMLHAQALSQLGSLSEARRLLVNSDTRKIGPRLQAELLSLIGSLHLEESTQLSAGAGRRPGLEEARECYRRARQLDPQSIVTVAVSAGVAGLLGDQDAARLDAETALRMIEARTLDQEPDLETRSAHAAALAFTGRLDDAYQAFAALKDAPDQSTRLLAAARYQARFVAEAAGRERDFFKSAFPKLQLLVFSGHLPRTERGGRLPLEQVAEARVAIRQKLRELDARAALGSAAAGGDLLFLDELLNLDASVHVVLPWAREEFRKTSVQRAPDAPPPEAGWNTMFDRSLEHAASVRELGQLFKPSDETNWLYLSEVASGLALSTARIARLDVQPVVLWDGQTGSSGGTAGFVKFWAKEVGLPPEIVEVGSATGLPPRVSERSGQRMERDLIRQEVKSMLFADIVGYSRLPEHVIPKFISVFMPKVSELAASSRHAPITVNTWGDAVYAVFDFAVDAGCFALELTALVRELSQTWLDAGLYWKEPGPDGQPRDCPLSIRIGLHTGPVFLHYDSIARQLGYTGTHVNRAARIEPVARPGEIYASEEFAALAELDAAIAEPGSTRAKAAREFHCDYAGTMNLAKGFPGRYRIYRVLPLRVLDLENLAEAIHEAYCEKAQARNETLATNTSLLGWDELPNDLKEANRAQAADIPGKLRFLGYELAYADGIEPKLVRISDEDIERLAHYEHDRWAAERTRQGWTYSATRSNELKHHPCLVSWEELGEVERDKDREPARNMFGLVARAGFRLRKITEE